MTEAHPLNREQRAAVEHGEGPLMVLAGAGTGKTRVLVHRIARLVEVVGVEPWAILAVTFTNKAAAEMRHRLRELLGEAADAMWIGTFHATCARILRQHGHQVGLPRTFHIFDDGDQTKIVERLLKDLGISQVSARAIAERIDRAKNAGTDPCVADAAVGGQYGEVLARVAPLYQAQLAREGAVDFNDLLLRVLDLLAREESARRLRAKFQYVLVDEFQDTNRVQYDLVRGFAAATRNLTVVGDDDQAIYAWRGAEPRNLLDFEQDFPDACVVKLEQNYRSTQVILDAANRVICKNVERHVKSLWTADRTRGALVRVERSLDERGEATFIARTIADFVRREVCAPTDVAILFRTNAQSRVLEEHLRAARIPAKIVGATSFFERKEIKDVIAYLRLLGAPAADSALERIVNVPARGIGDKTIERLRAHAKVTGADLATTAELAGRGGVTGIGPGPRRQLAAFAELIGELRALIERGVTVAELVIQVIERSGLRAKLEDDGDADAKDRLDHLAELVSTAIDFDEGHVADETGRVEVGAVGEPSDRDAEPSRAVRPVDLFLERIALTSAGDQTTTAQVSLMTIHVAKGLEWPVVFVAGMEDGLFPSLRERDGVSEVAQLEEERRLAYVAITRARECLILTWAQTRRTWGEIRAQGPSRFLDDV